MNCKSVKKHLNTFVDGELSASLSADVALHLKSCTGCLAEYEAINQVASVMSLVDSVEPPINLKSSILAAAFEDKSVCLEINKLFVPYLDKELDADRAELVSYHTQHCSECANELERMSLLVSGIQSIEPVAVPKGLYESIISLIQSNLAYNTVNPLKVFANWFNTTSFKTASAAAFCMILFAFIFNISQHNTPVQRKIDLKPTVKISVKSNDISKSIIAKAEPIKEIKIAVNMPAKKVRLVKHYKTNPMEAIRSKTLSVKAVSKPTTKSISEAPVNESMIASNNLNDPTEDILEETESEDIVPAKEVTHGEKFVRVASLISSKYDPKQRLKEFKTDVSLGQNNSKGLVKISF